jgi:hypothetical protein
MAQKDPGRILWGLGGDGSISCGCLQWAVSVDVLRNHETTKPMGWLVLFTVVLRAGGWFVNMGEGSRKRCLGLGVFW